MDLIYENSSPLEKSEREASCPLQKNRSLIGHTMQIIIYISCVDVDDNFCTKPYRAAPFFFSVPP